MRPGNDSGQSERLCKAFKRRPSALLSSAFGVVDRQWPYQAAGGRCERHTLPQAKYGQRNTTGEDIGPGYSTEHVFFVMKASES